MQKKNCVVCGKYTQTVFNINFVAVRVCDDCALTITKQEVGSWSAPLKPTPNTSPVREDKNGHKIDL